MNRSCRDAGLVFVGFLPADISFVDFDFALQRQNVAFHRASQAHHHVPASTLVVTGVLAKHDALYL